MDHFSRIFQLHRLLDGARRPVSLHEIQSALGCSRATAGRVIERMRDHLAAPILYDRAHNGYRYDSRRGDHPYQLPGLWLNASELHALLTAQRLLAEVQPGLLEPHLAPLRSRIDRLLSVQEAGVGEELARRVRILRQGGRGGDPAGFQRVAGALLQRRRLRLRYRGRARDGEEEREVSPQRLVHYRDNWYLDAWCHRRDALRSFALERIGDPLPLETPALTLPDADLDAHFGAAYGIFAGPAERTARLRFTPLAARWVAEERWHPQQVGWWGDDGGYRLEIPYGDDRELLREILRWGAEVTVEGPAELRGRVIGELRGALGGYGDQ